MAHRFMPRFLILVAVACHPPEAPRPPAPSAPPNPVATAAPVAASAPAGAPTVALALHPSLAPLAWMLGHHREGDGRGGTSEHWIAAGRALWGISFVAREGGTAHFEILMIDADERGALRLTAIPGGDRAVVFTRSDGADRSATFENPQHDAPKIITYARATDDRLIARVDDARGERAPVLAAARAEVRRAEALENADRVFAADVAARGVEGWMAALAGDAVMWRPEGFVRGDAAIRAAMGPLLSNPDMKLVWEPVTSGLSAAGDVGFTVGRYRLLRGQERAEAAHGTYVSLWRRQADGGWKVIWDGGHPA